MKLLTMIETLSIRSRRVTHVCALSILLVVVSVGMVTWAQRSKALGSNGLSLKVSPSTMYANEAKDVLTPGVFQNKLTPIRIESERVTLRRTGFEPTEITHPAGPFLISIDNKSEMGEMTFRLLRENGSKERDLNPKKDKFRLRHVVDLLPGRYTLVEANHPDWTCRITITP